MKSPKRLSRVNKGITKEQLVFVVVSVIAFSIFRSSYNIASQNVHLHPPISNEKPQNDDSISSQIFADSSFYEYWSGSQREPFTPMRNLQSLPSQDLELPTIQPLNKNVLMPIPSPQKQYWRKFPEKTFSPIIVNSVLPEIPKSIVSKQLSKQAIELKNQVRDLDIIQTTNGQELKGEIIQEDSNNVVLLITQKRNSSNYTIAKSRIAQIYRKINLESVCQNKIAELSNSPQDWIVLAKVLEEIELEDLAKKLWTKALKTFSKSDIVYQEAIEFYKRRLDYNSAYRLFLETQKKSLVSEKIHTSIAEIPYKLGFLQKSLQYLLQSDSKAYGDIRKQHITINEIFLQQPQTITCYLNLQKARLLECLESAANLSNPEGDNIQGVVYYLQGNLEKATEYFNKALQKGNIKAFYNLAISYFAGGASERALELLQSIKTEDIPLDLYPLWLSTQAYIHFSRNPQDNLTTSLEEINKALTIAPKNMDCLYIAAELYSAGTPEQLSQAHSYYSEILQQDFSCIQAIISLSQISQTTENYLDSVKYLREALRRSNFFSQQDIHQIYNQLAWLHLKLDNLPEAKRNVLAALSYQKTSAAYNMMGFIENKMQNYQQAIEYFDKTLELQDQNEYAQKNRGIILQNLTRVLWVDNFNRQNSEDVRRGWVEEEKYGATIAVENSTIVFSGRYFDTSVPTVLYRLTSTKRFVKFSGRFNTLNTSKSHLGIFIAAPDSNKILYFGIDDNGALGYSNNIEDWKTLPRQTTEKQLLLAVEKLSPQKYQLSLNEEVVASIDFEIRQENSKIGFFIVTNPQTPLRLEVDDAKIIENKE